MALDAKNLKLYISDGGSPAQWLQCHGAREISLDIRQDRLPLSIVTGGTWEGSLPQGVSRIITIEATGLLMSQASADIIEQDAISGAARDYKLEFSSGNEVEGSFLIERYNVEAQAEGEQSFSLTISSVAALQHTQS